MKTRNVNISATYVFPVLFLLALAFGVQTSGCARKPASAAPPQDDRPGVSENAININTASAEDLARLPQIGDHFARKIVEYREAHGPFRRPEHLMLIEGISDKKFRLIRDLVKIE